MRKSDRPDEERVHQLFKEEVEEWADEVDEGLEIFAQGDPRSEGDRVEQWENLQNLASDIRSKCGAMVGGLQGGEEAIGMTRESLEEIRRMLEDFSRLAEEEYGNREEEVSPAEPEIIKEVEEHLSRGEEDQAAKVLRENWRRLIEASGGDGLEWEDWSRVVVDAEKKVMETKKKMKVLERDLEQAREVEQKARKEREKVLEALLWRNEQWEQAIKEFGRGENEQLARPDVERLRRELETADRRLTDAEIDRKASETELETARRELENWNTEFERVTQAPKKVMEAEKKMKDLEEKLEQAREVEQKAKEERGKVLEALLYRNGLWEQAIKEFGRGEKEQVAKPDVEALQRELETADRRVTDAQEHRKARENELETARRELENWNLEFERMTQAPGATRTLRAWVLAVSESDMAEKDLAEARGKLTDCEVRLFLTGDSSHPAAAKQKEDGGEREFEEAREERKKAFDKRMEACEKWQESREELEEAKKKLEEASEKCEEAKEKWVRAREKGQEEADKKLMEAYEKWQEANKVWEEAQKECEEASKKFEKEDKKWERARKEWEEAKKEWEETKKKWEEAKKKLEAKKEWRRAIEKCQKEELENARRTAAEARQGVKTCEQSLDAARQRRVTTARAYLQASHRRRALEQLRHLLNRVPNLETLRNENPAVDTAPSSPSDAS
ncbi:unnamed protein product [Trypanosoma congolense IL3000]|uniref:WGS project CAEQ00000000 data, annotated contig 1178 n=1 Tax=Trypanosoma congolense (strain IL3000) TaxID=1068625 RepID=F9W4G4_TRYCI|nr:unnamed protein product [Trypanosoma congolense IL3000]